ncbi:ComEC/Rec2 family competence protein [Actinotalea sp. K2]|uniref:ComEC/Rec2 family competence protein n=1 Tax=Actinotalea sp. K2 TaxID=2939438 RepID=UPI002016E75D|nr:ComEC/Rec2 family competence protein [Actinotalea sp. K2]MCL3860579.1 ComEC/Rec2 family competence protein [Actinotalea sp. K2]
MSEPPVPADLRMIPAAVAGWLGAAWGVGASWGSVRVVSLLVAVVVILLGAVHAVGRGTPRSGSVRMGRPRRVTATAWLALVALAVVLASCAAQLSTRERGLLADLVEGRATATVVGVVRSDPAVMARDRPWGPVLGPPEVDGYRMTVSVEQVTGRGRSGGAAAAVLVLADDPEGSPDYGSQVQVTGRLAPVDPGSDVQGLLVATSVDLLDPPGPGHRRVNSVRAALLEVTADLPADARGLVPGASIGDTSRLPSDLDEAMRATSLTHITAVSGGHFAVVSLAVLSVTALLRLPRWARAVTSASALCAFVVLVRPEPSVVRAAAMGAVSLIGLVLGRPSRAAPALASAVVVLLVLDPWLARTYGFVLSVLATAALVLLAPPLAEVLTRSMPRWAAYALSVPVAAQAVCAPVVLLLEPAVGLYAVPANLLATPALLPATLFGVAAAVTAPWAPAVAVALAHVAAVATWWIALVARSAAGLPGARLDWPGDLMGVLALVLVTAVVLALVLSRGRALGRLGEHRTVGALVMCAVLLLVPPVRGRVLEALPSGWPPDQWQAVMCDVGQGDALVVRSGPRAAVVVDVGPPGAAADECLDRLGVSTIDLLVLTHHHADHVGGLEPVLAGREVVLAVVSPLGEPASQAGATLEALARAGVPTVTGLSARALADGDERDDGSGRRATARSGGRAGSVAWQVLWPHRVPPTGGAAGAESSVANDASVVVMLQGPVLGVLALGDLEPDAQTALLRDLRAQGIERPAEVVKVAHHGSSRQSADLARLLSPVVALIGAGEGNTYGHPSPTAIGLYESTGAVVLSTDRCGTVAVSDRGGALEVAGTCV